MARFAAVLVTLLLAGSATAADADPTPADPPVVVRQVGEVTATTTRAGRGNLETPGNISVIEREDIEKSGARDLPDLLRREAGIYVTNNTSNPAGYTIEARGFNNGGGNGSGTLVLVDGRRVNQARDSVADWALVRLDDVERVEVVRGPVNAAWGDNAQAGVINIVTRSGEGPPRFDLRGRVGSFDMYLGSLFAGGSHGPLSASIFLDGLSSEGFRDRSGFRNHGGQLKLGLDLGDVARLEVKGGYSSDRRNFPGTLGEEEIDLLGRSAAEPSTDENSQRTRVRFVDGTLDVFLAEDVLFAAQAWYTSRTDAGGLGTAISTFRSDLDSSMAGVHATLTVDRTIFGHANQLVMGGDWLRERADAESLFEDRSFPPLVFSFPSDTPARRTMYGGFIQDSFHILEDLILSGGVRYEVNDRSGEDRINDLDFQTNQTAWSPRAALTWRACDPLSLYASWARGFRFPNLDEAFGFFGFNPFLDQETSDTYEAGAKLRMEKAEANLAVYQMNVRDEIFLNPEIGFLGRNVNLDRTRHRGVEFQATLRPWPWLEIYGSYTWDDVELIRDDLTGLEGAKLPLIPEHRGTAGVRFLLPHDLEAGLNGNFVGPRPFVNDFAGDFGDLGSYQVFDTHFAWRPRIGEHLRLGIETNLYNLFDQEFAEVGGIRTFFDPLTFAPLRERRFFPSAGRNWDVRVMLEVTL